MINYDINDFLLEGGRSTIYIFKNNFWETPKENIIKGIIREKLLINNKVKESNIILSDFKDIKSIAISNSLIGLRTVSTIIKNGKIIWKNKYENSSNIPKLVF